MKQRKWYRWVHILVLLFTINWFILVYWEKEVIWRSVSVWFYGMMILTVILVHSIKAWRLYFLLYGKNISFFEYMKQYCKVIPVSMILPLKLGELFRMYCYGYQIENYFDGIMVILIERFADTLGLVSMILIMSVAKDSYFSFIFYILLFFLLMVLIIYLVFPGMYLYWKHDLLKARASKRKNQLLYLLQKIYYAYLELSKLIKGKFSILYLLSLIAWAVEISGLLVCYKLIQKTEYTVFISNYLISALLGRESDPLKKFIFISILLLFLFYFVICGIERVYKERGK